MVYIIPENIFNKLLKDGTIDKDTTLFIPSKHIPDNTIIETYNMDGYIDRLLDNVEEYKGLSLINLKRR
jgi:hypothetical protein